AIVGGGDKAVPNTVERSAGVRSGSVPVCGGAEEEERSAVVITGYYLREDCVLDAEGDSNILVVVPGAALVVGHGDVRMSVATRVTKIDASLGANSYRRVTGAGGAAGNRLHRECEAVVHGDDQSLGAVAAFVGNGDDSATAD